MKKLLPLLILAVIVTAAPAAMADHCFRCAPVSQTCQIRPDFGVALCDDSGEFCILDGDLCGDHVPGLQSLAAEFTVASVERLDEPQTGAAETVVASLETPKPATR